jgi:RNA polymerase sigma factor (sigma-70 family)
MDENQRLADQFEEHRPRLRGLAYRMLGSSAEVDDVVQEAWLRLSQSRADEIGNLGGWLTTVVVRMCLSMLRTRNFLRDEPLEMEAADREDLHPEDAALLADSVGQALQIVLDTLTPDERLAFILHDMFDLPFDEIAVMVGRAPAAARKLASRARHRVKGSEAPASRDIARERRAVDAFFAAARSGDFDALVAVLDPGVVLRIDPDDPGSATFKVLRGADAVANQALQGLAPALRSVEVRPVLLDERWAMIASRRGKPMTIMRFAVAGDNIVEIDAISNPERLRATEALASADE